MPWLSVSPSDGVEEELSRQLATLNLDSGRCRSNTIELKPLKVTCTTETLIDAARRDYYLMWSCYTKQPYYILILELHDYSWCVFPCFLTPFTYILYKLLMSITFYHTIQLGYFYCRNKRKVDRKIWGNIEQVNLFVPWCFKLVYT